MDYLTVFPEFGTINVGPGAYESHLGAGYVVSWLRHNGYRAAQYTAYLPNTLAGTVCELSQLAPHVIGLTTYDANYHHVKVLAGSIRQAMPSAIILAGGPTATFSARTILSDVPAIDACVLGEGELTVTEIMDSIGRGRDWRGVPGIAVRSGDGTVESDRPLVGEGTGERYPLDRLPSPLLDGQPPPRRGMIGTITSRGCSQYCSYCCNSRFYRYVIRRHSPDRVVRELAEIKRYLDREGTPKRLVMLYDDTISADRDVAIELFELITASDLNLRLGCNNRVDRVDPELLALMNRAGVETINYGLETAVPRLLRLIRKVWRPGYPHDDLEPERQFLHRAVEAITWTRSAGIQPSLSVISGLPTETAAEAIQTIDFVRSLEVHQLSHNYLQVFPGSEMEQTCTDNGMTATPSVTVLPLRTRYSYDLSEVPRLSIDTVSLLWNDPDFDMTRILTGLYQTSYTCDPFPIDLVFVGPPGMKAAAWVRDEFPPATRVTVILDRPRPGTADTDTLDDCLRPFISAGTPVAQLTAMVQHEAPGGRVLEVFPYKGRLTDTLHPFTFAIVGPADVVNPPVVTSCSPPPVVVGAVSTGDWEELSRQLAGFRESAHRWRLTGLANPSILIIDCCRFRPDRPSVPRRLVIDETGAVRGCVTGTILGTVPDPYSAIVSRWRGSQCNCVRPLPETIPMWSALTTAGIVIRSLAAVLATQGRTAGTVSEAVIGTGSLSGCAGVVTSDGAFIGRIDSRRVWRSSRHLYRVASLLLSGHTVADAARELEREFNLSADSASRAMDQAVQTLTGMGLKLRAAGGPDTSGKEA